MMDELKDVSFVDVVVAIEDEEIVVVGIEDYA